VKKTVFSVFAAVLVCHAQEPGGMPSPSALAGHMAPGMEVAGIRAPYYDDAGELQAQLYGGHAKVLEDGRVDIANLRIDIYRNGEVAMVVFAPQCFSQVNEGMQDSGRKVLNISSDGTVLIELDEMSIVGRGFRFNSENNRFEILHDSKVLVKTAAREAKGRVN
jgi:hypothetical protein